MFTAGAFAAAFLTAYYTFRMIFLVTLPDRTENREEPTDHGEHGSHAGEPWSRGVPVAILALGAMVIGFAGPRIAAMLGVRPEEPAFASMIPAVAVVLAGVAVAWLDFGRGTAARRGFIARVPALHTLFSNQWFVDDLYRAVLVRFTNAVATFLQAVETRGLDGGFNRLGLGVLGLGGRSPRVQGGWVQFYSGCAIIFLGAVAFYIGVR